MHGILTGVAAHRGRTAAQRARCGFHQVTGRMHGTVPWCRGAPCHPAPGCALAVQLDRPAIEGHWCCSLGLPRRRPRLVQSRQPLSRVPLWHRVPGLVCTAAPALTIEEQDWSTLALDVFPFVSGGGGVLQRRVTAAPSLRLRFHRCYSPCCEPSCPLAAREARRPCTPPKVHGVVQVRRDAEAGAGTDITLSADSHGHHELHIAPSADTPPRAWVVRVHLRPGQELVAARLDGAACAEQVRVLSPLRDHTATMFLPFGGTGMRAAPLAGPIVELPLPPLARQRTLRFALLQ